MRNDRAYRDAIKRGSERVDVRPRARDPAIEARAPARGWGSHGHIRRADSNSAAPWRGSGVGCVPGVRAERAARRAAARKVRIDRPREARRDTLETWRYVRGYLIEGSSFT